MEYGAAEPSAVGLCLFYLNFFSGLEQIISHSFSGCSLHGEACHETVLFNVEVNYNATRKL